MWRGDRRSVLGLLAAGAVAAALGAVAWIWLTGGQMAERPAARPLIDRAIARTRELPVEERILSFVVIGIRQKELGDDRYPRSFRHAHALTDYPTLFGRTPYAVLAGLTAPFDDLARGEVPKFHDTDAVLARMRAERVGGTLKPLMQAARIAAALTHDDPARARRLIGEMRASPYAGTVALQMLADWHLRRGQTDTALRINGRAAAQARQIRDPRLRIEQLLASAWIDLAAGEEDRAASVAEKAGQIQRREQTAVAGIQARAGLAEFAAARGDFDAARRHLRAARRIAADPPRGPGFMAPAAARARIEAAVAVAIYAREGETAALERVAGIDSDREAVQALLTMLDLLELRRLRGAGGPGGPGGPGGGSGASVTAGAG